MWRDTTSKICKKKKKKKEEEEEEVWRIKLSGYT